VKSFFSPPRFEDIREDHNARALNTILLVFILIFFAVALLNLLLQPEGYRLDVSGLVLGFLIGNWAALKRGRLKLVSIGFPAGLWLIVNLAAYLSGGFSSPVILGHFLVMTFAGLFVGRRAGMLFSFLGVLAALVLFGAETLGRLPPPSFHFAPITEVTTLAGMLLALGMMLYLEGSFLRQSLWSAGREINERRREISESTLREERFNALFERTTEAIVFMDFDSTILEVNARACEMFGFTREELIGLKGLTLVETRQRHEGEDRLRRVLTGEQPEVYERNMARKSGEQFPAEINLSLVLDRDSRPAYVQSVIRDISDRKRAELELMTRELQYRSLFERTNDAVFFISLDGYILRHNDRAAEMLGYGKDGLVGRHVTDLAADTEQDDVRSRLANLNTGESIALYERTFRKADGSLLRTEVNVAIVPDAAGKPSHIQSVVRDISDRREALNALRESEQKFRAFFETSDDAVYLKDANGMYLLVNPATAKVFGRNELDILFQRDADLFSPDDAQRITAFDQLVMQTGLRQSTESPMMIKGEERILFTTKMPYFAENGAVIGVIGVTRDTTDRRRYERELREFERRYHALFESSNDGVLILDLHGNVVEISDRAARMLGYAPHETVGKHITDFIPEVELAEHREKMRQVLSGEKQPIYERLLINRSGKIFPAEINVGLVTNPVGEPVYIQALMRDISERKRVDADRERMVTDLQLRSNQIQTAFEVSKSISSTIDMDTLLNEIINLIQMRFNFYYFGMFLNDQAGEYAVLRAGSGEAGRKMLAAGHRLRIGGE
jgi:PAS domain S-box-containing protein